MFNRILLAVWAALAMCLLVFLLALMKDASSSLSPRDKRMRNLSRFRHRFREELRATGTAWEGIELELRQPGKAHEDFWRATAVWRDYVLIGRVATDPEGGREVEMRLQDPRDTGRPDDKAYLGLYLPDTDRFLLGHADENQRRLLQHKAQAFYLALGKALDD
jgi:hypothetical protein